MLSVTRVLLVLLSLAPFSQAYPSPNCSLSPQVNTTSGLVSGHISSRYPAVNEFLGIPFAQPPIGTLRFAAPEPYVAGQPIEANKQPLSCVQSPSTYNYSQPQPAQNILGSHGDVANNTSEDCLYLNVGTRGGEAGAALKPVMIWVYGGAFQSGGAADGGAQGDIFAAEQDVVMVSFNYRLGFFGFPGTPGLKQNPGLLDQRLAVEWVRDNIAEFGGDPGQIILVGHSAGAASIDLYNYAWVGDPIISGSIMMSGTATSFGRRSQQTGLDAWGAMTESTSCSASNSSNETTLSCMQAKGSTELFEASLEVQATLARKLPTLDGLYLEATGLFEPTIDNSTVFSNYSELGAACHFIQKPILTGTNNDEACFYSQIGMFPTSNDTLITEAIFTCPVAWSSIYRVSAGLPTWKYRWFGVYPNLGFSECPGQPWHSLEVYVLFASSVEASKENATQAEIDDGRYLRQVFADFARDPVGGPASEDGWPTLNSDPSKVVALGSNGSSFSVANSAAYDSLCFTELKYGGPNI